MNQNNILRFKKDIRYDLLVPPLGFDFQGMTSKQAQSNFDWFISKIPERTDYLTTRCSEDLKISRTCLDYTAESLTLIWKWFLQTARVEKPPKEELEKMKVTAKIFGESFINYEQFSVATKYIIRDIGMYTGQCFVLNYPILHWDFRTKPKNSIMVNKPLIAGFSTTYKGRTGELLFEPMQMVEVQAAKIFDKTQDDSDLCNIYL